MGKQLPFFLVVLVLVMASLPTLEGSRRILQAAPGPSAPSSAPSLAPGPSAPSLSPSLAPEPSAPSSSPSQAPGSGPSPSPEFPPDTPPPPPPPSGGSGGSGGSSDSGGSGDSGGGGGGKSSGLSGGQKAGIVIGVLAGAGLIGFATLVYMKRHSNIRRARFAELSRRSQL